MADLPNLDRLARRNWRDQNAVTSREMQVLNIRDDYYRDPISASIEKAHRMSDAVPALLAHIDELYGEINALKAKCGKQADMLAYHCKTRDDILAMLDRFNTVPADDVIAETLIDSARNLLGGAR